MAVPAEPKPVPKDHTSDSRADHAEPIDHEKDVSELQTRLAHNAQGLTEELDDLDGIVRKHDTANDHKDVSYAISLFKTQMAMFRLIAIVKESYRRPVGLEANRAVSQLVQGNGDSRISKESVAEPTSQLRAVEADEVSLQPGDDDLPNVAGLLTSVPGGTPSFVGEQAQQEDKGGARGIKERILGKK